MAELMVDDFRFALAGCQIGVQQLWTHLKRVQVLEKEVEDLKKLLSVLSLRVASVGGVVDNGLGVLSASFPQDVGGGDESFSPENVSRADPQCAPIHFLKNDKDKI